MSIDIKTINFESLTLQEMEQIRDEIDCLIKINKLYEERFSHISARETNNLQNFKNNLNKERSLILEEHNREKAYLLEKIEKDKFLLREKHERIKNKLNQEDDDNSSEDIEAVVYDKTSPKGRSIIKNKSTTKRSNKKK